MFLTDVDAAESIDELDNGPRSGSLTIAVSAAVKAVVAVASGLLLTCGLGLVIWAITPSSGTGPIPLLRAGVTAFSAANGMTVSIGRAALTLPPLMIALVAVALLAAGIGRGRVVPRDRNQETIAGVTGAVVYAVVVVGTGVGLGSHGAVRADQWWRPALLAVIVIGCTTLARGQGWRPYLIDRLPLWVPVSVRLGAVGTATLLGGGAATLVIGLVRSFSDSSTVQTLAAPGAASGFGMALLGIAYLPNAVIAGAGYCTGVGFSIGSGTYSPFGSAPVELPAVSLLTAAPDGHAFARPTALLLLFPVLAAVLIGRGAVGRLDLRNDRLAAVGGAALFAALASAVMAGWASGGVTGGEWSSSGVPPALFGLVVAVGLGAIGAAVAGVARVPASAATVRAHEIAVTGGQRVDAKDAAVVDDPLDTDEAIDADDADIGRQPVEVVEPVDAEPVDAEHSVEIDEAVTGDDVDAGDAKDAVVAVQKQEAAEPTESEAEHLREEEVLAEADAGTDGDSIADPARPRAPRQVG